MVECRYNSTILNIGTKLKWVVSAPVVLPPGEISGWAGPQSPTPAENLTLDVQPIPHLYSNWAIPVPRYFSVHKHKQHIHKVNTSVQKNGTSRMLEIRDGQNRCWLCIAVRSALENAKSNVYKNYIVVCRPIAKQCPSKVDNCNKHNIVMVFYTRFER